MSEQQESTPTPFPTDVERQEMLLEALCLEVRALTLAFMSKDAGPALEATGAHMAAEVHTRADQLVAATYGREAPGAPAIEAAS